MGRGTDRPAGGAPLVSVLTGVWNTDPRLLAACIDSVRAQVFADWELCLVDDGSTRDGVARLLDRYAARDPRIRVQHREANRGISRAQNDALAMATGQFVALLDHDDLLDPEALLAVAGAIGANPDVDVIYTDEEVISADGDAMFMFRKPDWSPEYLLACHYFNHLTVYRTSVVVGLGGFRDDLELAQDWDLAFRVTRHTDRIVHIPRMLYRYRDTAGSAGKHSGSPAARCDALGDHLQRRGDRGEYEDYLGTGVFRVRFPIVGRPLVSVLVPTGGRRRRIRGATKTLVLNCLESVLARTTYENFEVVCAVDDDTPADVQSALADMAPRVRCITTRGPFDFSAKMNRAAGAARGDYLLWLNDDTEVLDGDWMTALLEYAQQDGIGAVGPKLLLPNGTIQQAGIAFFEALPYHAYWRFPKAHWGAALGALVVARQYLAVGGACLMTPRSSFEQVGGLSEDYPCNLGDIDYCLKLRELGQRCVVTPWAELIHYEAASRPRIAEPESAVRFVRQWGSSVARDPYHDVTWEGAQRPG